MLKKPSLWCLLLVCLTAITVVADTNDTLGPGPNWDGTTTWNGRTIPTASPTVLGSGFNEKVIAAFDEPPYMWVTGDKEITVGAEHGDTAWVKEVVFWLEGETCTVTKVTKSPRTDAIGFVATLKASQFSRDGDAELYAKVRPYNGYERVIGPLAFTFNGKGTIVRPIRYVNFTTGNNSWDGTSRATAWKTFVHATDMAPAGAIIKMAAGTYLEDSNNVNAVQYVRTTTIQPDDGLTLGDVIISKTERLLPTACLRFAGTHMELKNIVFSMDKLDRLYASEYDSIYNPAGAYYIYNHCNFLDPNGPAGPPEGYWDIVVEPIVQGNAYHYSLECSVTYYTSCGFQMMRNTSITESGDSFYPSRSNISIWNTAVSQPDSFQSRLHEPVTLTAANIQYDAGTDKTTITWSGTPLLNDISAGGAGLPGEFKLVFLSGPLTGQIFVIDSQSNAAEQTVLIGNVSAAAGDTCWGYIIMHPDFFQYDMAGKPAENIFVQRYKAIGITAQPIMLQSGAAGNAKDIGIQLSILKGSASQVQQHSQHVVIRQSDHFSTAGFLFRTDDPSFTVNDFIIQQSVFTSIASGVYGTPIPSSGIILNNNHYEELPLSVPDAHGTGPGTAQVDSNFRPLAGSPLLNRCSPKIPFDYYGNPLPATGAPIGAVGTSGAQIIPSATAHLTAQNGILTITPNPLTGTGSLLSIHYSPAVVKAATAIIYNLAGKQIYQESFISCKQGGQELIWNGKNESGVKVGNGVYTVIVEAGGRAIVKQITVAR